VDAVNSIGCCYKAERDPGHARCPVIERKVETVSDPDFDIEVPEEDRLEQLQEVSGGGSDEYRQDDPPSVSTSAANPADVLEQHAAVPEDDDEW
jgi:hypothetical protein